VNTESRLVKE